MQKKGTGRKYKLVCREAQRAVNTHIYAEMSDTVRKWMKRVLNLWIKNG